VKVRVSFDMANWKPAVDVVVRIHVYECAIDRRFLLPLISGSEALWTGRIGCGDHCAKCQAVLIYILDESAFTQD
jgi:hypothetical protein